MARDLVLHDGQLAERIVTESHQNIELPQLQDEVNGKQTNLDQLLAQQEALSTQITEAQAALADSKSDLERGTSLVEVPANDGAEGQTEDGTGEPSADSVEIPIAVL